ncbi:MAG: hypothetical protein M0C28_07940 [Candidatus Moduliflexus flocculans]|nr:hypothetical protein [Candidatus Moduliflexus flocculans]
MRPGASHVEPAHRWRRLPPSRGRGGPPGAVAVPGAGAAGPGRRPRRTTGTLSRDGPRHRRWPCAREPDRARRGRGGAPRGTSSTRACACRSP